MQVARRGHREPHVGNGPLHLMLVIGNYRIAAALDDDLRQRVGLIEMIVVGDDSHDVVRLDRHADRRDQLRIAPQPWGQSCVTHLRILRISITWCYSELERDRGSQVVVRNTAGFLVPRTDTYSVSQRSEWPPPAI